MAFCYKQKPQNYCAMDAVNKSHGLRTDLEETVSQMEKRHGELTNRRRYLAEKIMTLEKAMPLLVANKFWKCGQRDNTPCKKIQEFVDQLSPYPYPNFTDKLLKETNGKSQRLDEETKQLHVEIDIKIEETGMELESLLLINNELDQKIKFSESKAVEREQLASAFPDLHEIDPEDVACLGRIRQLVQQEIRLKNCISSLEDRETRMQNQLNRLLVAKEGSKQCLSKCSENSRRRGNRKLGKSQNHPMFGVYSSSARDDMCHCGSDESFFQDNPSSEDDSNSSDGGNSEEYWECCDCQASSEPNTQNSGCAASVMSRKK
ncbi:uncharacterized protein LOC135164674 isoform X2 [Diachasmimorpha longicaudata]|uniref:uncharacterized protein LOC135164674 isoform X2 n=1 Tax=Diachasmimorpha longicaudata TaxID=58733 RepID=UPI0030B89EA0